MDFSPLSNCTYAVIGCPIDHSRSPQMQNAAFRCCQLPDIYGKLAVTPEELPEFFDYARAHLRGVNITVPLKEHAAKLVDELDDSARGPFSVNTLVIDSGVIRGYSTDGIGLRDALRETLDFDCKDHAIMIIGAGGAASAAAFQCAHDGATALYLLNRTPEKLQNLADRLRRNYPALPIICGGTGNDAEVAAAFENSDLIIHATSLGWHDGDPAPVKLPENSGNHRPALYDLVYRDNALQQAARRLNMRIGQGESMLVYQGAASFTLWTGLPAPVEAMRQALRETS